VRIRFWSIVLAGGLSAWLTADGAIPATAAVSTNTFGTLKVEVATTNTMIAVPWTWHSKSLADLTNLPVKKLVKPENLELGDMIYTPMSNDVYAAWVLGANEVEIAETNGVKVVHTNVEWSAIQVVKVEKSGFGRMLFTADDDGDDDYYETSTRIKRGNGLWLRRQKPLDAEGKIRPFWLYGQSVTGEVTTVVAGTNGLNATVCSTMIGNPYAEDVVLNSLTFQGKIESGDRIKIHTSTGINRDLTYVAGAGKGWRESTTVVVNGRKRNVYSFSTVIPAGTAFWYDRRGNADLTIKWPVSGAQ